MEWILLVLVTCGIVGGLLQSVPMGNDYVRRSSGALISLGFLGVLLWSLFLTAMSSGMMGAIGR